MFNKKLNKDKKTKLSKTLDKINNPENDNSQVFIKKTKKSSLLKTKSFRLREADIDNLSNIAFYVNSNDNRMEYSDSQIIRGLINYISDNADSNIKKLMTYIKSSS
ncbi:MAG: hypothetical protein HRU35_06440 [Rickettsiaceae bacterium]|nr:hypothetical protein [Rickettsiaceae bacterium]